MSSPTPGASPSPGSSPPSPPAATPPAPSPPATTPPATPPPTITPPATPPPTITPPVTPVTPPPAITPPASPPPTNATSPPPPTSPLPSPTIPVPSSPPPPDTGSTPPPESPPSIPGSSPPPPSIPNRSPPPPSISNRSPPPPSNPNRSPSPPGRTPPSSAVAPSSSNSISTGVVVGIAIAGAAALVFFTIIFFCCCNKRRRRRNQAPLDYGYPPPPPPKADSYGGQPQNWQNIAPPPENYVVKIPPQPSPTPPPAFASRPPHSPSPPSLPPLPPFTSSGGSGSNYSGSETPLPPPSPDFALGFSKSTFTYEELAMATDGFSDANLLGQGGFGYVHRGVLLSGKEVAVKQLKAGSGQGEREFQAEVEIISRVHHKHLVSLVGYCMAEGKRLLVYEFVPNNTLEFHLHAGKGRPVMEWPTRLKIALGSAKGLAYLHEDCHPKIIHRDIKASNILLDFRFEPKVADFGLAKIASDTNTHVSTRVMGTFGYLAPEYASSGKLTDRSDVFSFGVMLLELITGRRPVDKAYALMDESMVDWARPLLTRALEEGIYDTLVDPRLQKEYNPNEMARMVACAAASVRHSARRRPRMSQIVRALEGAASLEDLNEGITPGHSRLYGSSDYDSSSQQYNTRQYNDDMKRMRKLALESQEYGSSEYSGRTSEYGLNPSCSSSEGQQTREMEMSKMKKQSGGFSGSS